MNNLLKWELKQTFKSKAFWGFLILYLAVALLLLVDLLGGDIETGYNAFSTNINNLNGFLFLTIGIYGGIHFADAFEGRRIQAAVMAGNSRLNVVLSKIMSFSLVVAIYCVMELVVGSTIGFMATKETGVDSWKPVIVASALFTLAWVVLSSICFIISMIMKKTGGAVALNTVALLLTDLVMQFIIDKPWGEKVCRYTFPGQVVFSLMAESRSEIITSALVSVSGLLLTAAVAYIIFRKIELK